MSAWLPSEPVLAAFVAASLALAVTPGPGVLYIVSRSLLQGRRAGLASVAGVALGNLGNALGAAVGLAALFALSAAALTLVKFAGAGYLIWLAVRTLRTPAPPRGGAAPELPAQRVFRDGFLVALLNPKTALFFAAFLPQFVAPGASAIQTPALAALFVAIAALTDTVYALTAGAVAPRLARTGSLRASGRWLGAGVYLGLGLFAAVSGSRPAR